MLIVLAASNTLLLSRLDSWIIDGWSGTDPEQIRVIDYAARQIKSDGKDHAAIGYDLFIRSWWAIFNVADHRYKIGADLDLFFEYRYGIVNTNRCAEGVSTEDTYRIVQGRVITSEERAHIDIPSDDRFHVSQTFESFQLLQRPPDGP